MKWLLGSRPETVRRYMTPQSAITAFMCTIHLHYQHITGAEVAPCADCRTVCEYYGDTHLKTLLCVDILDYEHIFGVEVPKNVSCKAANTDCMWLLERLNHLEAQSETLVCMQNLIIRIFLKLQGQKMWECHNQMVPDAESTVEDTHVHENLDFKRIFGV